MTLVANQMMWIPRSDLIRFELVGAGADIADRRIVELLNPGDLVISADIPLAAAAVAKGRPCWIRAAKCWMRKMSAHASRQGI